MTHAEIVDGIKRCRHVGECESCERVLARQERIAMARAIRWARRVIFGHVESIESSAMRMIAEQVASGEVEVLDVP